MKVTKSQFFSFKNSGISPKISAVVGKKLAPYIKRISSARHDSRYQTPESFLYLPFDNKIEKCSHREAIRQKRGAGAAFIIGTGGSLLGAQAVYGLLRKNLSGLPLYFIDSPDAAVKVSETAKNISGKIVLVLISRSGMTAEIMAAYAILQKNFSRRQKGNCETVVVSQKKSSLWEEAKNKGWFLLEMPEKIGGRWSLYSAAGIFPLALAGVDLKEMRAGARRAADDFFNRPFSSLAFLLAASFYAERKRPLCVSFYEQCGWEDFSLWLRQLHSETLGKKDGIPFPTASFLPRDLHSHFQFYMGAKKSSFFEFVGARNGMENKIPSFPLVRGLSGVSVDSLNEIISREVKGAYRKRGIPFSEIKIPETSAFWSGYVFYTQMLKILLLAKLFSVPAFSQDAVEETKHRIFRRLKAK